MKRRTHRSLCRCAGFTLVEILIVVVILGILASLVIPQFTSASADAKAAMAMANRRTIHNAIVEYVGTHGSYPEDIDPDWFVEDRIPPNPYAPDWSGEMVQIFNEDDADRRVPDAKTFDPEKSWARPYWYHPRTGDIYVRVPEMGSEGATLELFNKTNGLQLTALNQTDF